MLKIGFIEIEAEEKKEKKMKEQKKNRLGRASETMLGKCYCQPSKEYNEIVSLYEKQISKNKILNPGGVNDE